MSRGLAWLPPTDLPPTTRKPSGGGAHVAGRPWKGKHGRRRGDCSCTVRRKKQCNWCNRRVAALTPPPAEEGGAIRCGITLHPLIPAKAGIQIVRRVADSKRHHCAIVSRRLRHMIWIPAFAGMSGFWGPDGERQGGERCQRPCRAVWPKPRLWRANGVKAPLISDFNRDWRVRLRMTQRGLRADDGVSGGPSDCAAFRDDGKAGPNAKRRPEGRRCTSFRR
ncbi:hypothetical protein D3C86_559140 [compost metagenome]